MGIRDILVHLDNSPASVTRLGLAIAFASKHGACLRGLYLTTHLFYEHRAAGEKSDSEKAELLFKSETTAANIPNVWILQDSSVMNSNACDLITKHAYFTDLVILGQANLSSPVRDIPTDLPERVCLASGRPVLVVPYAGSFQTAATRVMIAWKAGRESVRSLNDSLPLLKMAHKITVSEIGTSATGKSVSLENVHTFLAAHSIESTTEMISSDNFPVADMILNNVCEKNIDLLVMGAFAPNRRGALELGQVAKHIMKHLTVPVLISH